MNTLLGNDRADAASDGCARLVRRWFRPVALIVLSCAASSVPAQSPNRRPVSGTHPKAAGVLEKLEGFQTNVKRRLQSALGVDPATATDASDATPERIAPPEIGNQWVGSQDVQIQSVPPSAVISSRRGPAVSSSRLGPAVSSSRLGIEQSSNGERPAAYTDPLSPGYSNEHRTVEYEEPYVPSPSYQQTTPQPLPPPVTELPAAEMGSRPQLRQSAPSGAWGPPGRAARTASRQGFQPVARGNVLGENPVTATERAILLLEQNGELKAQLAMLEAENQRLKERLTETQSLLSRSTTVVDQANQELDRMVSENKKLAVKLKEAETRHNRYLLETDRMLQSIREELDDVLIRELSSSGKE